MGTLALKERFKHDKVFLQAIVSYVKKYIDCIENLLYFFHDLEFMNRSKRHVNGGFLTLKALMFLETERS